MAFEDYEEGTEYIKIQGQTMTIDAGLKDGGTRQSYGTGAMKEDSSKTDGKGAFHLLPFMPMQRVAEIWRKGAVKYTKSFPVSNLQALDSMLQLCSCHQTGSLKNEHVVIQIYRCMQKECAALATKYPSVSKMLSLLKDRERIVRTGSLKIEEEKEILTELIKLDPILKKEGVCAIDINSMHNLGLLQMKQTVSSITREMNAQYVEVYQEKDGLISTTTTPQENQEDSYALNAIKVSGFWGIIFKAFKEHSNTCKIHHSLSVDKNGCFIQHHQGSRNWEKGLPLSRYIDSGLRHLMQCGLEGKIDEDHLHQGIWNFMALSWTIDRINRGLLPATLNDLPGAGVEGQPGYRQAGPGINLKEEQKGLPEEEVFGRRLSAPERYIPFVERDLTYLKSLGL